MTISYIGTTVAISAAVPATEDSSGYALLSWTTLGQVVDAGEIGDNNEDISFDRLADGRKIHVNGTKDLGDIPFTLDYLVSDAGQVILKAGEGSNTTHSMRITDSDGEITYFQFIIANYKFNQRAANSYKGISFVARGRSGLTIV